MSKMIFVILPVADLAASIRFYEAIGCERNAQFSDDKAASMVWSDIITFQLMQRDYFASFTTKPVADAHASCQALLCLTRDSRGDVDALAEAAGRAGGRADGCRGRVHAASSSCSDPRSAAVSAAVAVGSRPGPRPPSAADTRSADQAPSS